jgi:transglutaminase-like putative cysteine protease
MNARKAAPWVAAALVAVTAASVGLRLHAQHELELSEGDSLWRLTYTVEFNAKQPGAKLYVALPADTPHSRVFRRDLIYLGLTEERLRQSRSQTREISLATLRSGPYAKDSKLIARFHIHLRPRSQWEGNDPSGMLAPDELAHLLQDTPTIQAGAAIVAETLKEIQSDVSHKGDVAERLCEFCHQEIARGDEDAPQDAAGALEQRTAASLGRARALVALCRAGKIPARLVTGFEVKAADHLKPHVWVEAKTDGRWEPFDPNNGYAHSLPYNFVPVRRDGLEIVRFSGAEKLSESFALERLPSVMRSYGGPLMILDLTRLPLEMHHVLSLILLMPLGALVTSIFRTIVGLRTFGTFTPTLIALAFIFADWRTGIFVFAVVIAVGLVSRTFIDRLRLLMVPRLSVILTIVVFCIIFAISLLDYYRWTPGAQAVLLPMVILTMTIERFFVTTEEDGSAFALQLMAGTIFMAFCCYLVLRWQQVGTLLLTYPELHFATIAVLILIGRYTGYRLTELWRFRDLTGP